MLTGLEIRAKTSQEVLDYQFLLTLLGDYSKPRDRITALLADGSLVRVRKGLYVFGDRLRRAPVCREQLSNMIYGPSYVSLDYALSYHGLIPERVENVTSVTTGSARRFATPLGVFTYRPFPARRYTPGAELVTVDASSFLMATPEKALVDKVWTDRRFSPLRLEDFRGYLFEDLRLDEERLAGLNADRLDAIVQAFDSRKINMLARYLSRRKDRKP